MNKEDLKSLKKAGYALSLILKKLKKFIKPGVTGLDINNFAEEFLKSNFPDCNLSSKGYGGFPASVCVSFNDNIIHGIPSEKEAKKGDIIKVDIVVDYKGWHADSAYSYIVGKVSKQEKKLVKTTKKALDEAIKVARVGNTIGDIGYIVQNVIESQGFSVMRKYCGHGLGKAMHEAPSIPNFGTPGEGAKLEEGMIIAIEPMAFIGDCEVEVATNGWDVYAKDKSQTAHFEHTLLIRKSKPVVITK
ncbi:MAG: type I methionyl aminopeptidase [Candidatus Omnitrophica bacterium]|nr:type I methionyl aminopeptidase [Candidatus Omnitrophota bacterium]MCF7892596.1 type I methionyl aminopeptidase [Candidatus Omnitrophota bacterium]